MPVDRTRIIELALANLEGEKRRVDAEIAELRAQLGGKQTASKKKARATRTRKAGATKVRSARQNAKTAAAMRALWVKVRKAGFTNIKDYKASLA